MPLEAIEYLYRPLYRPPSSATLPEGWDYVEVPPDAAAIAARRGLPISRHQFGIIAYNRRLTEAERKQYGLAIV